MGKFDKFQASQWNKFEATRSTWQVPCAVNELNQHVMLQNDLCKKPGATPAQSTSGQPHFLAKNQTNITEKMRQDTTHETKLHHAIMYEPLVALSTSISLYVHAIFKRRSHHLSHATIGMPVLPPSTHFQGRGKLWGGKFLDIPVPNASPTSL